MRWLRWLLAAVCFGVVLHLFWPLLGEIESALHLLRQADWVWLAAAVGIQVLSYSSLVLLNVLLLRPFGGHAGFRNLLVVLPAIACIEVAIPSAGASGVVLRARLLRRLGYSAATSTFTVMLESLYLFTVMMAVGTCGLVYLLHTGEMSLSQLAYLVGLTILVGLAGGLIFWTARDRERAKRVTATLVDRWKRLRRRWPRLPAYSVEQVWERVDSFYDGLTALGKAPRWPFWVTAGGRVGLDVATLWACFVAFHHAISPGVLLTGYGLTLLFSALTALPGGTGLGDASLAVIYARLGTPGAVALAAALCYRLLAFWLLRFIGFCCWQALEATHDDS